MGAALSIPIAPLAGCGSWTRDLRNAGVFADAMRHIRHVEPGLVAGLIDLRLPSTVTVQMLDTRSVPRVAAVWEAGRVRTQRPTQPLPDHAEGFELTREWPLLGDVQFTAQQKTGTGGVGAPGLETVAMWVVADALELSVVLTGQRPVHLRYKGGPDFEELS